MVKFQMDAKTIEKAIKKLSLKERARLIDTLLRDTWKEEWRQLIKRVDAKARKNPISQKEINEIVEEAKEEYHAKSRHRHKHIHQRPA